MRSCRFTSHVAKAKVARDSDMLGEAEIGMWHGLPSANLKLKRRCRLACVTAYATVLYIDV
jgi:hypothetical protein